MFCPVRGLNAEISDECVERHCAFWTNHECVIAGFLRSFVRGEAAMRDEPGL